MRRRPYRFSPAKLDMLCRMLEAAGGLMVTERYLATHAGISEASVRIAMVDLRHTGLTIQRWKHGNVAGYACLSAPPA
jgi:biotin operon repressor